MEFNIAHNPEPLAFGKGKDGFALRLKQITGEERMSILDAARDGSMQMIQGAVDRLVIGWEGVVDAAGNPIPLEYQEDGMTKKRFNDFLGAVSCEMQIRVISGILAFVGIPTGDIDELVKVFRSNAIKTDTAPTPPPDDDTPTTASGG